MRRFVKRSPSAALVISLIALFLALGGGVYAASTLNGKAIKKGSEPGNRLKKNSVTGKQVNESTLKLPAQALAATFPIKSVTTLNFGQVNSNDCSGSPGSSPSLTISAPGIKPTDNVLVTPPPGWAQTFALTAIPNPANNSVTVAACNNFFAGSGDPDGGGGPYKLLVIR